MELLANLQLLSQTGFDSGALSGLGAVVHQLAAPGEHRVTVLQADTPIQTVPLQVLQPAQPPEAGPTVQPTLRSPVMALPEQLHVDLGTIMPTLGQPDPQLPTMVLQMVAPGYALFSAPPNGSNLAVQIHAPGADNQPPIFDSRQLGPGDIFSVTLLRPGRYSLADAGTATGEISVSYPVIGDTPYQPPDPLTVQVTDQGFQPNAIQLMPAQGLIFQVGKAATRIQINLVAPDDGPTPGPTPLFRWEKPTPQ